MKKQFDHWCSTHELCVYLGISRDTALCWVKIKNRLAHKIGRFWEFRFHEIGAWVKAGRAKEE